VDTRIKSENVCLELTEDEIANDSVPILSVYPNPSEPSSYDSE
jgi:hypothetical protein